MLEPKFQVGQEVEANTPWDGYVSGVIKKIEFYYTVELTSPQGTMYNLTEDQIRLPRPSPEEAWEKATMLIGVRSVKKDDVCLYSYEEKDYDKETRHQVYQILGSAGIPIKDEVKADVRRLIALADNM